LKLLRKRKQANSSQKKHENYNFVKKVVDLEEYRNNLDYCGIFQTSIKPIISTPLSFYESVRNIALKAESK